MMNILNLLVVFVLTFYTSLSFGLVRGPHHFFSDYRDALLDASAYIQLMPERTQVEFGGWVIQDQESGCFTYLEPIRGVSYAVAIPDALTVKYTWGLLPIAWFHSHPGIGSDGESYSSQDYSSALIQGGRQAALFTPSGRVHVFDPTRNQVETLLGDSYRGDHPWQTMRPVPSRLPVLLQVSAQCEVLAPIVRSIRES